MSTITTFQKLNSNAKQELVSKFLLKISPDFIDFLEHELNTVQFSEGDLALIKNTDSIVKIYTINVDRPWTVLHEYYSLEHKPNGISSNLLLFSDTNDMDFEALSAEIPQSDLIPIPHHVYLHFYHQTFKNGKMVKSISKYTSFKMCNLTHLEKIVKIPTTFGEPAHNKEVINFEDIQFNNNFEIVYKKE